MTTLGIIAGNTGLTLESNSKEAACSGTGCGLQRTFSKSSPAVVGEQRQNGRKLAVQACRIVPAARDEMQGTLHPPIVPYLEGEHTKIIVDILGMAQLVGRVCCVYHCGAVLRNSLRNARRLRLKRAPPVGGAYGDRPASAQSWLRNRFKSVANDL